MEQAIDISVITNINDLKALAYDQIAAKEKAEMNLNNINQRILELMGATDKSDPKEDSASSESASEPTSETAENTSAPAQ